MTMEIWPAIDLRGGKCVRLVQGDYDRETVFGDDPAEMARRWRDAGADRLHLVDLDGARDGRRTNAAAVSAIRQAVTFPCQLGGGVRDRATIEELLALGLNRLVVGTSAVRDPDWFLRVCRDFPHQLVLGLDAREGRVATDGWVATSDLSAAEFVARFEGEPLAGVVYTDIARDGMLQGPNLQALDQVVRAVSLPIIASGGVTTADDVRSVADIGASGCIIGRTLYEGLLTLEDALAAARR